MAVEAALPTLLCSRPRIMAEPVKQRSRPVPFPLDTLEESKAATLPALQVKNTFLESAAQLSPSLEHFYQPRAMQTCPSKRSGCITSLLEEMPCDITEASTTPTTTPLAIETPCSMESLLSNADVFQAHANAQPVCGLPLAFPNIAMPIQVLGMQEQFGGAGASMHDSAPASPSTLLMQGRGHYPRPVLNLADALGSDALSGQQQAGAHFEVQLLQVMPAGGQTVSAATSSFAMNSCAPPCPPPPSFEPAFGASSQPPPPPAGPALGTEELPSVGSGSHAVGCCKPCAFLHSKGCENGLACKFCHLCGPEERKRRRQGKLQERREINRARQEKQAGRSRAAE